MAEAVQRASEIETGEYSTDVNSSDFGVWNDLYTGIYNGQHTDSPYDNEEIMPKQKQTVAYIRVSTQDQDTAMQKTYIETQMSLNGVDLSKVQWFEEKISATKKEELKDRPVGSKLHSLVSNGEVKQLYCYKLDRLFRKQWAAHSFVGLCQLKGTDIISMDTPSGLLTDEGFLLYSINFMMGEMEARRLARRTSDGMASTRKKGGVSTSAIFGWNIMEVIDENGNPVIGSNDKVVKKCVPNWQEQAIINWIKQQVADGLSFNKIARILNELGIRGKKGGKWQAQSIKRCLESKQHQELRNFKPPKRMQQYPFTHYRKSQGVL